MRPLRCAAREYYIGKGDVMNKFGENLQFYRRRENLTQEQLAERLEVSRQTVSKWEAGVSFAEMEKLLQLCDLFSCDMDTLLRKDAGEASVEDNTAHRAHMKSFRIEITIGVAICILGAALYEILAGFQIPENVGNTVFLSVMILAVLIFIVCGIQNDNYKKKHPVIQDFYTEEEKEAFDRRFPVQMAAAIGVILIGMLVFGLNGEHLPLKAGMNVEFYYGLFLFCVAVGVGILIYSGMQKDELDVAKYNKENQPDPGSRLISVWCGCIMILATIIFFVSGFVFTAWRICWIVYPVGGMLCGIATLIIGRKER